MRHKLNYANVMATLAVFVALGGGAYAASQLPNSSVGTKQIKKQAVKRKSIAKNAINSSRIADGGVKTSDLAARAVDASRITAGAVGTEQLSNAIPAARLTNSTTQVIPSDSNRPLALDTEIYDVADMHTDSADNSRLTAPVDGIYAVTAQVRWAPGTGVRVARLIKNGSELVAEELTPSAAGFGGPLDQSPATQAVLKAGDFVQVVVRQNSGSDTTVFKDEDLTPEFSMAWLAPGP